MASNDTALYTGGAQTYAVAVEAGASDHYSIRFIGRGGSAGTISDGGAGVNNSVVTS